MAAVKRREVDCMTKHFTVRRLVNGLIDLVDFPLRAHLRSSRINDGRISVSSFHLQTIIREGPIDEQSEAGGDAR